MKDTFYFQHDYNARNDPKLQEVLIEYGAMGLGVFWCIIEHLYEQGGRLSLRSCKSIAFALHVDCKVVESVVQDFDLFKTDGTSFWSNSVIARLDRRKEVKDMRKKAAKRRWEPRDTEQMHSETDASAMQMHSKTDASAMQMHSETDASAMQMHSKTDASAMQMHSKTDASAMQMHSKTDASAMQMQCKGKERKGKERKGNNISCLNRQECETAVSPKVDFDRVIDLYHSVCQSFPRIIKLSKARKQKVEIRFVDEMKSDWALLENIFNKMEDSKFLRGDNPRGWKASFDWLFSNDRNWCKVAEGNYDNRAEKGVSNKGNNINDEWQ